MRKKGMTLIEVLLSMVIVALGIGAIFLAYPTVFEGVRISSQRVLAWELARKEMEILKNSDFAALYGVAYNPRSDTPVANTFSTSDIPNSSGVYYIEKIYGDVDGDGDRDDLLNDLIRIEVVICLKAGRRVLGEDKNLDAVLDSAEDENNDKKISSPVSLYTLVIQAQ